MPEISVDELVEEVSKLNEKNENELYAVLGYQSLGLEDKASGLQLLNRFSITKSELIVNGRAYFEKYKQQLKEKICVEGEYCKKKKEFGDDFKLLAGALIPVIITGINLPAPLITVLCALAFKYGLNKLCGCKA